MIARAGLFHAERGQRDSWGLNAFASLPIPGLTASKNGNTGGRNGREDGSN
jgi:hypothetical protein